MQVLLGEDHVGDGVGSDGTPVSFVCFLGGQLLARGQFGGHLLRDHRLLRHFTQLLLGIRVSD